jgi:hypothetical protein
VILINWKRHRAKRGIPVFLNKSLTQVDSMNYLGIISDTKPTNEKFYA